MFPTGTGAPRGEPVCPMFAVVQPWGAESGVAVKRIAMFAVATIVATAGLSAAGAGVASAAPVLALSQSTGLTDGQAVTITVSGLTMDPLATLEISECGNAYGDNSALASIDTSVGSRDCQVIAFSSTGGLASSSSIQFANIPIKETGIGAGNRSCAALPTPCIVYISQSNNEGGTHASSNVSFAADALGAVPAPTQTEVELVGAPLAVSKAAYAHVEVHRVGDGVVPEGSFSVSLDGGAPVPAPVGADGSAMVQVAAGGSLALGGGHTISANYIGDGSFASSSASPVPFSIVADLNISIGDASIVNSNVGTQTRVMVFPIVLSKPPTVPVTVNYQTSDGTAVAGTDYTAVTGRTRFNAGPGTAHYVAVKILPNANPGDRSFSITLSAPVGGIAGGYELRRPTGTGTVVHDTSPAGPMTVNIGSSSVPEGDTGGAKALKFSVTLSSPATSTFRVLLVVAADTATHKTNLSPGDWTGGVSKSVKFSAGQTTRTVSVATLPDLTNELDETLTVDVLALCTTATTLTACTAHPAGIVVGQGHAVGTILTDE